MRASSRPGDFLLVSSRREIAPPGTAPAAGVVFFSLSPWFPRSLDLTATHERAEGPICMCAAGSIAVRTRASVAPASESRPCACVCLLVPLPFWAFPSGHMLPTWPAAAQQWPNLVATSCCRCYCYCGPAGRPFKKAAARRPTSGNSCLLGLWSRSHHCPGCPVGGPLSLMASLRHSSGLCGAQ